MAAILKKACNHPKAWMSFKHEIWHFANITTCITLGPEFIILIHSGAMLDINVANKSVWLFEQYISKYMYFISSGKAQPDGPLLICLPNGRSILMYKWSYKSLYMCILIYVELPPTHTQTHTIRGLRLGCWYFHWQETGIVSFDRLATKV